MGTSSVGQKMGAVFYKNYLYRRERWLLLAIELALPTIVIGIYLALKSKMGDGIGQFLVPIVITISLFVDIVSNVGGSVSEKETGFKELLKIMGLDSWIQWIGWLINSLGVTLVAMFVYGLIVGLTVYNKHCDWSLVLIVILVATIQGVTFAYFLSSFFSRHTVAMALIGMFWFVCMALHDIIHNVGRDWGLAQRLPFSIIPHYAAGRFFRILTGLPKKFDDTHYDDEHYTIPNRITWSNMFDPIPNENYYGNRDDNFTPGLCLVMMLVTSVAYVVLSMYIENIIPAKYGVRKPFYYPFLPSTWFKPKGRDKILEDKKQNGSLRSEEEAAAKNSNPNFETEPSGLMAGVAIKNLKKRFGKLHMAVDGVTLNMYQGQITALLGHNGAGKTTTLGILTGMMAPSTGTALINGHDITTDLEGARKDLGFCPQENMLFDRLSVTNHLQFIGLLKGLTRQDALAKAEEMLTQFDLRDKRDVQARHLSGGQKRKLQLGMALVGQSKIVVLDEPTSGMDPETRRLIWNVLLRMREGRTIVLTTHFLEEADVLGDRIAIMAAGKLRCMGSPLFLKKIYGSGYTLHITLHNNKVGSSSSSSTPPENKQKVETQKRRGNRSSSSSSEDNDNEKTGSQHQNSVSMQILAIVQKYVQSATLKSAFSHSVTEVEVTMPTIDNSNITAQFPALFTDLYAQAEKLCIEHIGLTFTTMDDVFAKVGEEEEARAAGVTTTSDPQLNGHSKSSKEADEGQKKRARLSGLALTRRQFYGLLVKRCQFGLKKYQMFLLQLLVGVVLMIAAILMFDQMYGSTTYGNTESLVYLFPILVFVSLSFHSSSFILLPLDERLTKSKQLQLMTGVSPISYWLSTFIWDFACVIVVGSILTLFIPILHREGVLLESGAPAILILIFAAYGFAIMSINYAFSLVAPRLAGGFAGVLCFHLFGGSLLAVLLTAWESDSNHYPPSFLPAILTLLPPFAAQKSIMKLIYTLFSNTQCDRIGDFAWYSYNDDENICDRNYTGQSWGPNALACCENCDDFSHLGVQCFEKNALVTWSDTYTIVGFSMGDQRAYERGLLQYFLYQILVGLFFFTIILLYEHGVFKRWAEKLFKNKKNFPANENQVTDEDVQQEKNRIGDLVKNGHMHKEAIAADGLSKNFGNFAAASKISFGVNPGVCFGLLGVNGAGKTTFFRMLTGDTEPSAGNSYIMADTSSDLAGEKRKFLSSIGYCPQFDAIVGVLSGAQMLELFCRLRGLALTPQGVRAEAHRWLVKMGLEGSANVECAKYSGGMKRRLSTAMALIGQSPILMLDEPSSGVDPLGRRQLWKILASSTKNSGQAIILTSHSMEECEALCTRLSIMVNGEIQCIGSVEHLKNKFAQGYCLTVKLTQMDDQGQGQGQGQEGQGSEKTKENQKMLQNIIASRFVPSILLDQNQTMMQFQLQNTKLRWNDVFSIMEDIRKITVDNFHAGGGHHRSPLVDDYVVNETSLEQIFLHFARAQYPERDVTRSCFTRFFSCQCCSRV